MLPEHIFYNRIVSRWDVWAQQSIKPDDKGRYGYHTKKQPLTQKDIDESILTNNKTIGAYSVNPDGNTCTNPQIDIDNHDDKTNIKEDAVKIFNELKRIGLHPYIEASSGELEQGAHIGMICKPTAAKLCKEILDSVLKTLNLSGHEVFPKQTEVKPDSFGNLVKLPFQFNNRTMQRSQIINPKTMQPFEKQEAINYLMTLPDSVFEVKEDIETPIQPIKDDLKASSEPIKSDMSFEQLFGDFETKPCIKACFDDKWVLHGKGDEGHNFRIAIAGNMMYNGATEQQVHDYFGIQSDYSKKATKNQIKSIQEYLAEGKRPMGCRKIREKCSKLLNGMCDTCENKPKEKSKKAKQIIPDATEPELDDALGVYHGAMELAEEMQKITQIYFDASQNHWMWKKDLLYYKRIDETDILSSIRKRIPDSIVNSTFKSELLTAIKITGRERNVQPVDKHWIRFNEKVYDLETKQFFKPEPTHFYTYPIPHNVGASNNTPTIDKLFKDWMGDDAISLYEICAYCLLDDYPIHRLFILYGRGRNGKSQFMEILSRLVGIKNTTSTDLETILTSKFEAVKLYGKKLALIGETNFNEIKKTDKLKRLTGQDMVQGEYKNKDPFDFYNTAKMIVATNGIPETTDKSDGLMSRIIIKEFKNQFDEGKSVVDLIGEVEYENLIKKCIPILERLIDTGKFTNEGTIEEKAARYEKFSNPFPTFMSIELTEDTEACIPVWVVRGMYETFCVKNGFRKPGEKEFTQLLHKEGIETKKKWWDNKNWNTACGIQSKDPYLYVRETEPDEPDEPRVQTNIHTRGQLVETPASSGSSGSEHENTVTELPQQELVSMIRSKILELAQTFPDGVPGHVLMKALENIGADMQRVREAIARLTTGGAIMFSTNKNGSQCYVWVGV